MTQVRIQFKAFAVRIGFMNKVKILETTLQKHYFFKLMFGWLKKYLYEFRLLV